MKRVEVAGGLALKADVLSGEWVDVAKEFMGGMGIGLVEADPPFGGIVTKKWDRIGQKEAVNNYHQTTHRAFQALSPHGVFVVFFGTGKPGMRPGWQFASEAEHYHPIVGIDEVVWRKKRGYGTDKRLLYVREEFNVYVRRGETYKFKKLYTDQLRGYSGFNKDYPALSEYKRLTNVWDHISDMQHGKVNPCQKPTLLYRQIFEGWSTFGGIVSLFSGSGSACLAASEIGARFVAVENGDDEFDALVERLKR